MQKISDRFLSVDGSLGNAAKSTPARAQLLRENRILSVANEILGVFVEKPGADMYDSVLAIFLGITDSQEGVFGRIDQNGALICPTRSKPP